ncbi:hypothetical protein Lser_V15G35984 [Lactuca serriola]
MEAPPPTQLKKTNTYLKLQQKLLEIEAEVIQFTNLPGDTLGLDHLAEQIEKKIAFFKNLLNAETVSHDSTSNDLSEIEGKLEEVEAEFFQSNSTIVNENDDSENSSGSVCEHCSNNEPQVAGNENWKVYENSAMFYEAMMSPTEMFHKPVVPPSISEMIHEVAMPPRSDLEDRKEVSCDCEREQTGGCKKRPKRWWWRTLVVLMTVQTLV